jgi:NAD(P)-dependent dehydrogenase (short-subunit alcohol dehydrogenase family)
VNIAITGAGSGLGRVIAERFAQASHRIFACDVSHEGLSTLESSGVTALVTKVDVSDREQLESWFKQVFANAANIDVLINNVGVAGPRAEIEDIEHDDWRRTLAANLDAAFLTTRLVLPAMKRERFGVVINVSTSSVLTNPAKRAPYVVSKAALEALTLAVAREAGPYNVRCNAVRPGMMDNDRLRMVLQRIAAQTGKPVEEVESDGLRYVWMHKKIEMVEVADLVVFLTSDAARSITGQIIAVDGGMHWED